MNSFFASSFIYMFYIYVVVELVLGDTPCTGKTVPVPLSAVGSFCFYLKNNLSWETLFFSCVGPPQGPGNLQQRCSWLVGNNDSIYHWLGLAYQEKTYDKSIPIEHMLLLLLDMQPYWHQLWETGWERWGCHWNDNSGNATISNIFMKSCIFPEGDWRKLLSDQGSVKRMLDHQTPPDKPSQTFLQVAFCLLLPETKT